MRWRQKCSLRAQELSSKIKGTGPSSIKGIEWNETRSLILRRRLQILVHSNLYYSKDSPLVPDYQFDRWAQELVQLQKDFPKIASKVDYAYYFKDFDGSTGMDLPYHYPEIEAIASSLVKNQARKKVVDKRNPKCYDTFVLKKRTKIKKKEGKRNGKTKMVRRRKY